MAAVCKGLPEKVGVTSTVLHIVAEQALKRYGVEKKLSKSMLWWLRPWELSVRLGSTTLEKAILEVVSSVAGAGRLLFTQFVSNSVARRRWSGTSVLALFLRLTLRAIPVAQSDHLCWKTSASLPTAAEHHDHIHGGPLDEPGDAP